jgi:16S rRNA (adenine1518-N6/adenine1519-N6)-dimethyltransferase
MNISRKSNTMSPTPKKRFGQHWLTSPAIVEKIMAAAGLTGTDVVLEIGPGRGVLTGRLVDCSARVVAVEVDRQLAQTLRDQYAGNGKISIAEKDFLKTDLDELLPGRFTVVANLPYYITVPIIEKLLGDKARVDRIIVMVQKEMAARMAAAPGGRAYGSLSVFIHYHAAVEILFDVPPGAFIPPPKVTSSVIRLTPRTPPVALKDETAFFAFVKRLFNTRRKMLRATLRGMGHQGIEAIADGSGIDLARRPETLDMQELFRLYATCQQ